MPRPESMPTRPLPTVATLTAAALLAGCGSSASTSHTTTVAARHGAPSSSVSAPGPLHTAGSLPLPATRSGIAASVYRGRIVTSGGLSGGGVSTDAVFAVDASGHGETIATLPTPVHDAASAVNGAGRLLLFGGGQTEGSDRIVQVQPGTPRLVGTLPQALSDLTATAIGTTVYVAGGWNGTDTNRSIYAVTPGGSVSTAGTIPLGVRYPAAGTVGGKLIVAGGETATGTPTADAWSFDPATGAVTRLPDLPAPTDHTAGVGLDGTFYVLGGLREGVFTDAILSWRPGERRWHRAGRLPGLAADAAAVTFAGGVALVGGRDGSGPRAEVTLLRPR